MTKLQDKIFMALLLKAGCGIPEKEYKFHGKRRWRIDYAWPSLKIGVEINGGVWKKTRYRDKRSGELITQIGGRHTIGNGYMEDKEKKNTLTILGWALLEYTPQETTKKETMDQIVLLIQSRRALLAQPHRA